MTFYVWFAATYVYEWNQWMMYLFFFFALITYKNHLIITITYVQSQNGNIALCSSNVLYCPMDWHHYSTTNIIDIMQYTKKVRLWFSHNGGILNFLIFDFHRKLIQIRTPSIQLLTTTRKTKICQCHYVEIHRAFQQQKECC